MTGSMRIFLIGFAGSGKSSLGKRLAKEMKLPFMDSDDLLVKKYHADINRLFTEHGEFTFRRMEENILFQALNQAGSYVLSCGGGTPCFFDNMNLLKANGITVYLQCSEKVLAYRLIHSDRPLVKGITSVPEMEEKVREMLENRSFFYEQADLIFPSDKMNTQTVNDLRTMIENFGKSTSFL